MKKVKTAAALLCSACLVLSGTAVPTMADSVKVVTLGADLTQDQKNTMMKYFNVDSNQVQILTITTISSVASSFFVLSSCSPVAVSYAI